MKRLLFFSFLFLQFFCACNNAEKKETSSENDLDAARNFIQAALNGDYIKARHFMLRDSSNDELIDNIERNYRLKMNAIDKKGYQDASITTYASKVLSDSVSIINYSNSYKKKKDSLKVVRINGQWVVDLKYSFLSSDSAKNVQ